MKIAIVTCERLSEGITEDQPLYDALTQAGIEFDICVWSRDIDWAQFDMCLLRSVWDYHEKSEAFMLWVHETSKVSKIQNSAHVIEWNSNKNYLKELAEYGLQIASTLWLEQNTEVELYSTIKQLPASEKYFLKPTIGADSSGTHRFNVTEFDKAQSHLNHWIQKHDMMLQSYLPSVESYGEVSAIYFGGGFSHALRKIPINGDYRVQDTFGAKDIVHTLTSAELLATDAANQFITNKFGALCYARIDLLLGEDGQVYINELELIEPSLFLHHAGHNLYPLINSIILNKCS